MPVSITNPDLLRHSTELYMDSGFSPLCQRMGAMVAFRRFEEFTRYPGVSPTLPPAPRGAAAAASDSPLFMGHMGWGGPIIAHNKLIITV